MEAFLNGTFSSKAQQKADTKNFSNEALKTADNTMVSTKSERQRQEMAGLQEKIEAVHTKPAPETTHSEPSDELLQKIQDAYKAKKNEPLFKSDAKDVVKELLSIGFQHFGKRTY